MQMETIEIYGTVLKIYFYYLAAIAGCHLFKYMDVIDVSNDSP